jgi:hypothetical protein
MRFAAPAAIGLISIGGIITLALLYGSWTVTPTATAGMIVFFLIFVNGYRFNYWGLRLNGIPMSRIFSRLRQSSTKKHYWSATFQHNAFTRILRTIVLSLAFIAFIGFIDFAASIVDSGTISAKAIYLIALAVAFPFTFIVLGLLRLAEKFNDVTKLFDLPGNKISLYLRSFDDDLGLDRHLPKNAVTQTPAVQFEASILGPLSVVGSVVAIGAPTDAMPRLGASRLYCGDRDWKEVVGHLMNEATFRVIVAGDKYWLSWEFNELVRRHDLQNVVVVIPPGSKEEKLVRWMALVSQVENEAFHDKLLKVWGEDVVCMAFKSESELAVVVNRTNAIDIGSLYSNAMTAAAAHLSGQTQLIHQ